jgi:hypothetical protein
MKIFWLKTLTDLNNVMLLSIKQCISGDNMISFKKMKMVVLLLVLLVLCSACCVTNCGPGGSGDAIIVLPNCIHYPDLPGPTPEGGVDQPLPGECVNSRR